MLLTGLPEGAWTPNQESLEQALSPPVLYDFRLEQVGGRHGMKDWFRTAAHGTESILPEPLLEHGVPVVVEEDANGGLRALISPSGGIGALVLRRTGRVTAFTLEPQPGRCLHSRPIIGRDDVSGLVLDSDRFDEELEAGRLEGTGNWWMVAQPRTPLNTLLYGPVVVACARAKVLPAQVRLNPAACAFLPCEDPGLPLRSAAMRAMLCTLVLRGVPWPRALDLAWPPRIAAEAGPPLRPIGLAASMELGWLEALDGRPQRLARAERLIDLASGHASLERRAQRICAELPLPVAVALRRATSDVASAQPLLAMDTTVRAWETLLTWAWVVLRVRRAPSGPDPEVWPGNAEGFRTMGRLGGNLNALAREVCGDGERERVYEVAKTAIDVTRIRDRLAHELKGPASADPQELLEQLVSLLESWDELLEWRLVVPADRPRGMSGGPDRCLVELHGDSLAPPAFWARVDPDIERHLVAGRPCLILLGAMKPSAPGGAEGARPVVRTVCEVGGWVSVTRCADGSYDVFLPLRCRPDSEADEILAWESPRSGRLRPPAKRPGISRSVRRRRTTADLWAPLTSFDHRCTAAILSAVRATEEAPLLRVRRVLLAWQVVDRWFRRTREVWEKRGGEEAPASTSTLLRDAELPTSWNELRDARNAFFHRLRCPLYSEAHLAGLLVALAECVPFVVSVGEMEYEKVHGGRVGDARLRCGPHECSTSPVALMFGDGPAAPVWWASSTRMPLWYESSDGTSRQLRDLLKGRTGMPPAVEADEIERLCREFEQELWDLDLGERGQNDSDG